jgi:hypothetical protein
MLQVAMSLEESHMETNYEIEPKAESPQGALSWNKNETSSRTRDY